MWWALIPRDTISHLQLSLPIQLDTWCCIQPVILCNLPLGRHLYIISIEYSTPVQGEAWLLSVTHSTTQGGRSEKHFPDEAQDQVWGPANATGGREHPDPSGCVGCSLAGLTTWCVWEMENMRPYFQSSPLPWGLSEHPHKPTFYMVYTSTDATPHQLDLLCMWPLWPFRGIAAKMRWWCFVVPQQHMCFALNHHWISYGSALGMRIEAKLIPNQWL